MQILSDFILRRAGLVAVVGSILAGVGCYYTVQLYKDLRTDLEELLPTQARSVLDLEKVTSRLESIDNLAVLVFSQNTEASKRFIIDLANRLETIPEIKKAGVEYRIDRELAFFKKRRALYMELDDLIRIRDYIFERVGYEKSLYNPLTILANKEIPEPRFDFFELEKKYKKQSSSYSHFPKGFFATPDETKRVLLVNSPGKSVGIEGIKKLKNQVAQSIIELKPTTYASDIEIHFTGNVEETIQEQEALVEDLALSTILVSLMVTAILLIYYRSAWATLTLVGSLIGGVLWTFGVSFFCVGYLNANSAFLGSIVIGNGINFGVITLARYLEEFRKGGSHDDSIRVAMTQTATATLTAALAAGLSYGSLVLTGFRGFKQFGIVGLIGMILCWISAFTLLPAFLTLLNRWKPQAISRTQPRAHVSLAVAKFVETYPRPIWGATVILIAASLLTLPNYSSDVLETNLSNLRNIDSVRTGAGFYTRYLNEIFKRFLTPNVVLPETKEHALAIAQLLREKKDSQGPDSFIVSVQTIDDFIPHNQAKKIKILRQIEAKLPSSLVSRLSNEDRDKILSVLTPEAFIPISENDLPQMILRKFREKDGTVGKLILVEPPLSQDIWKGENLVPYVASLREIADSVEPGAPVAGGMIITSDLVESIMHDGPRATLFALLAVFALVIILFRQAKTIFLVAFSLSIGVIWLGGIILGFGLKINFLNFIVLPITFGIGVDYGVNIFQRYRNSPDGNILEVIKNTGGAVVLCSLTTITGYTSLLIARNQGFVSFGILAALGEITCVISAVISLPAFLMLRNQRRNQKPNQKSSENLEKREHSCLQIERP